MSSLILTQKKWKINKPEEIPGYDQMTIHNQKYHMYHEYYKYAKKENAKKAFKANHDRFVCQCGKKTASTSHMNTHIKMKLHNGENVVNYTDTKTGENRQVFRQ
jgi:hypothetical protein